MAQVTTMRILIPVTTDAASAQTSLKLLDKTVVDLDDHTKKLVATKEEDKNKNKDWKSSIGTVTSAFKAMMALAIVNEIRKIAMECLTLAENARRSSLQISAMAGSAAGARAAANAINELSASSTFLRSEVSEVTRQLLRAGTSSEEITRTLRMLGNIAAGTGQDLSSVAEAYSRVQMRGELTYRQIQVFGAPILRELSELMYGNAESINRVQQALSSGGVSFDLLRQALENATTGSGAFANASERDADSITGSTVKITNAWTRFKTMLGQQVGRGSNPILDWLSEKLNSIVDQYNEAELAARSFQQSLWETSDVGSAMMQGQRNFGNVLIPTTNRAVLQPGTNTGTGSPLQKPAEISSLGDITRQMDRDIALLEQGSKQKLLIEQNLQDRKQEIIKKANEQAMTDAISFGSSFVNVAQNIASGLLDIAKMAEQGKLISLDNEYKARKKQILATVKDEKQKQKALDELDQWKEDEAAKIKNKAAKEQKELAIWVATLDALSAAAAAFLAGLSTGKYGNPAAIATGIAFSAIAFGIGMAKVAAIAKMPVPQYQHGGSMIVPPGYSADSALMAVNSGERVDVTPARFSGGESKDYNLVVDGTSFKAYLAEEINRALNNGSVQVRRRGAIKTT